MAEHRIVMPGEWGEGVLEILRLNVLAKTEFHEIPLTDQDFTKELGRFTLNMRAIKAKIKLPKKPHSLVTF